MSSSKRRGFLAAVTLTIPLVVAVAPAASAEAKPKIEVSGGLTRPVFSRQDTIREHVRMPSLGNGGAVRLTAARGRIWPMTARVLLSRPTAPRRRLVGPLP
jgi:hypothetical protein